MPARPLLVTGTGPVAAALDTKLNSARKKSFIVPVEMVARVEPVSRI
jgi:hypothetical protein